MDPSFELNGPGAWTNVTIVPGYGWTQGFMAHSVGDVSSGGSDVLVHASPPTNNNTIHIATLDEATKTLLPASVWTMESWDMSTTFCYRYSNQS